MPQGEFCLHNNRAGLARLTAVFGGVGVVASAAGFLYNPYWCILGALGIAVGAMFAVIGIRNPLMITLSGAGLTARGRDGAGVIPASAIEAVGLSKIGRVHYVTLWYDTVAVPSIPLAFDRYLRAMAPGVPGRIHIGAFSETDDAERISELHRLVAETGLGEWRDHPAG
ncbi:hypothetical protein GCM10023195_38580 [Actinoallomurus liliacearum]|uniref:Uncharacterized protein n=1 Tax=Actinoallomurus liliacearum TaxID=1080073 RepID=A0ABP8TJ19_9ACTN